MEAVWTVYHRERYLCCRCGRAAVWLDENSGALYCSDCAEDAARERFEALERAERMDWAGLTEIE